MRDWHPRMDVSSLASVPMAKVAVLPYKNINIVIHSFIATAWHCWLLVVCYGGVHVMNSLVGCCCCCCCFCCWRSKWFTVGRFQYVSVTLVQRSCTLLMVEVEQFLIIIMLHQLEVPKENVLVLG